MWHFKKIPREHFTLTFDENHNKKTQKKFEFKRRIFIKPKELGGIEINGEIIRQL